MALNFQVIYIGVTDFLQKREREKFEKEEAAKKKSGKKGKVKARTGPRGFGQKVEDNYDNFAYFSGNLLLSQLTSQTVT